MKEALATIMLALGLLFVLSGCGVSGSDDETVAEPGWRVESNLLPVDAAGHFLSDIVYTWTSSSSWTPPNFGTQSFQASYTVERYGANGVYEFQRKVLESGTQDWDQDASSAEGWVTVHGIRGTYTYDTSTFVMAVAYTEYCVKMSTSDTTPLVWRPLSDFTGGWASSCQWTTFCTEKHEPALYVRIAADEFKRTNLNILVDGGTRAIDSYYSVDFAGATPVVTYREERIRRSASSVVDPAISQTYMYVRAYSGVVGLSPSTPSPASLAEEGNYSFIYTVRTENYYDWDTGTDSGFLPAPRTGYPQITGTASTWSVVINGGNLVDWGVYSQR